MYRYNAANQLVSRVEEEGRQDYAYDRRGNLTAVSRGEELLKAFTFDAANRMDSAFQVKGGIGRRAKYQYDAFGNRAGQTVYSRAAGNGIPDMGIQEPGNPEKQIRYTIDLTRQYRNVLAAEDNAGQKAQTFYWDGNVAAMEEDGQDSYYLQDDLGSPMHLLDGDGEVRESYGFDEFGQALFPYEERQAQPFGYTGYQMEETGGLYFAQARRYDAGAGRFVSEDKLVGNIERPFSLNRYGYCWNNPLVFIDLNGLDLLYAIEGFEAHFMLETLLSRIDGVKCEVSIPGSAITGNNGRADIVYEHGNTVEIYEIKPMSYKPGTKNNPSGKEQLGRYVENYWQRKDSNGSRAIRGTSLNPFIDYITVPSLIHHDKMIKYYTYPSDPGMIYWGYVNKPDQKKKEEAEENAKGVERSNFTAEDMAEDLGTAAIVGIILVGLYELLKWGAAFAAAGPTGGGSLAAAACLP